MLAAARVFTGASSTTSAMQRDQPAHRGKRQKSGPSLASQMQQLTLSLHSIVQFGNNNSTQLGSSSEFKLKAGQQMQVHKHTTVLD
jgi:hypothetical protein